MPCQFRSHVAGAGTNASLSSYISRGMDSEHDRAFCATVPVI